ncbi:MAG: cupredoxin domain-containing protein [Thermoleophilia bacterium]|nr:cupredoxin domain-containing protein [Thermoleophilia bacterium]
MRFKTLMTLVLVAVVAIAVAGCGSSKSTSSTATTPATPASTESTASAEENSNSAKGATVIELAADPSGQLKYDKTQIDAKAGEITINFTNDSPVTHDVAVKDSSGKQLGVSAKIAKSKSTLKLKGVAAGTYTYYCTVPGHEAAGQKGTLTVK